jgi:uncharacterized protein YaeQ
MLPASVALHFRITLSHVDRAIDRVQSIIVERHRTETTEHLMLRVLAWCLFHDDQLQFGPGVLAHGAADLWARDPAERPTIWIEVGDGDADKLRKMVQHSRGVQVAVLFSDVERRDHFLAQLAALKRHPPELAEMGIWRLDPELVATLASNEAGRQRWVVTIVGDHLYVETDTVAVNCPLERSTPPPPDARWEPR